MNKKLLIITSLVFLFVVVVIVWYFFYAKPVMAPSLSTVNNPLPTNELPKRFLFRENDEQPSSSSFTEITQLPDDPLVRVWGKPATGQHFITQEILKEETATTTAGTSTVTIKRAVKATSTFMLFVDRETGYVYAYEPKENTVFQVTNSSVPGVYDAYIFEKGTRIIMRFINQENEFIAALTATLPPISKSMTPLPLGNQEYLNAEVTSVVTRKEKGDAVYTVKSDNGISVYSISKGVSTFINTSPFGEWVLSAGGDNLYATTKASAYTPGVVTLLPNFSLIQDEKNGLIVNPSSLYLLTSHYNKGSTVLSLVSTTNKQDQLSTKTLASKCGWKDSSFILCGVPEKMVSNGGLLPDAWYKGLTSFEDTLVYINPKTLEEIPFFSFSKEYGVFDVINMIISDDGMFFSFINKKTNELWVLKRDLIEFNETTN